MLAAIILTVIVSIGFILAGLGMIFLAYMAEAMSPIPGKTHTLAGKFAAVAV
ncbi:hypothetical protein [Mesorhizobium sp. 1M-11]|uniref:hypothetical protein n=1 Tax=Mesorhizobium sp. 1M-11 TaxID=1529006 RepID=UPI000A88FB6F|nr:hypothetical protein [Mesorhizobium sp. 1M-11]